MSAGSTHIRKNENEFVKLWIHEGFLFIECKPDIRIDLPAAIEIVGLKLRVQNEQSYPVICFINGVIGFDKAASDYLDSFGLSLTPAICFVGTDLLPRFLFCYYLRIYKPLTPARLVSNEADAVEFLTSYT